MGLTRGIQRLRLQRLLFDVSAATFAPAGFFLTVGVVPACAAGAAAEAEADAELELAAGAAAEADAKLERVTARDVSSSGARSKIANWFS